METTQSMPVYAKCVRRKRFSPQNKMLKHAKKLKETLTTVQASIDTVAYQIKNLHRLYSKEQIRCWQIRRYNLKKKADELKAQLKQYELIGIKL